MVLRAGNGPRVPDADDSGTASRDDVLRPGSYTTERPRCCEGSGDAPLYGRSGALPLPIQDEEDAERFLTVVASAPGPGAGPAPWFGEFRRDANGDGLRNSSFSRRSSSSWLEQSQRLDIALPHFRKDRVRSLCLGMLMLFVADVCAVVLWT